MLNNYAIFKGKNKITKRFIKLKKKKNFFFSYCVVSVGLKHLKEKHIDLKKNPLKQLCKICIVHCTFFIFNAL